MLELSQKQWIRLGLFAERAHRLGLDLALQSSSMEGERGRGIAIVADETRNIGIRLYQVFDEGDADGLEDVLKEMRFLSVNGEVERFRLEEARLDDWSVQPYHATRPLAVLLDEVRNLINDVCRLFGFPAEEPVVRPAVSPRSSVVSQSLRCMVMTVGGRDYAENVSHVREVFYYAGLKDQVDSGILTVRGVKLPVLNTSVLEDAGASREPEAFVVLDAPEKGLCALPVDRLPVIFRCEAGVSAAPRGMDPALCRECWDCEEGRQLLFLDYGRLF